MCSPDHLLCNAMYIQHVPLSVPVMVGPAMSEQNTVYRSPSRCTLRGQATGGSRTNTCCHQPTDVCHVRQQPGVVLVCNLAHARVVVMASVG